MIDLFERILANSFINTQEDIEYLSKHGYVKYHAIARGGLHYVYYKQKEFSWGGCDEFGVPVSIHCIISSHLVDWRANEHVRL